MQCRLESAAVTSKAFPTKVSDDIVAMKWLKLFLNANTAFDVSRFNSQIAAQVLGFEPDEFGLDQDTVERMDR